jgi:hypothetical protein
VLLGRILSFRGERAVSWRDGTQRRPAHAAEQHPERPARALRRHRGFAVALAVVVGAGTIAVITGAPQDSKLLSLLSGHGWLPDALQGQIVLANGQTGLVDLRDSLTETVLNRVEVIQTGNRAVLVDTSTGTEGTLDLAQQRTNSAPLALNKVAGTGGGEKDLRLGTSAEPSARTELVAAPSGDLYAVNRQAGTVSLIDPLDGRTLQKQDLGSPVSQGVIGSDGELWVESVESGALVGVSEEHGALHVTKVQNSVVAPGNQVELSSVNGIPAVLDKTRALFFEAPGGAPGSAVPLPAPAARDAVIAASISGPTVPVALTGHVVIIHGKGASVIALSGRVNDRLGPPIPYDARIYVPDLSDGQVVVLDDEGQQTGPPITLTGPSHLDEVSIQNGVLFLDNANSNTAYSVNVAGQLKVINKANPNVATNLSTPVPSPTPTPVLAPVASSQPTRVNVPTQSTQGGQGAQGTPGGQSTSATTIPASAPGAPGTPVASAGDKSATIQWTAPTSNGGSIISYSVIPTPACASCTGLKANSPSTTVTGLKNGTSYTFSVRATNAVGTGPPSVSNQVTPSGSIPDAPTGVVAALGAGNSSVAVSWQAANSEGLQISHYNVYAVAGSGSATNGTAVGSTTNPTAISLTIPVGTTPGAPVAFGGTYSFYVEAVVQASTGSGTGTSSQPSALSNSLSPVTAPSQVTLSLTRINETQFTANVTGNTSGQAVGVSFSGLIALSAGTLAPSAGGAMSYTLSGGWNTSGTEVVAMCVASAPADCSSSAAIPADLGAPTMSNLAFSYTTGCEANPNIPSEAAQGYGIQYTLTMVTHGLPAAYVSNEEISVTYTRPSGTTGTNGPSGWTYSPTTSSYAVLSGGWWVGDYTNNATVQLTINGIGTITATNATHLIPCPGDP